MIDPQVPTDHGASQLGCYIQYIEIAVLASGYLCVRRIQMLA